jgi:hypothetical protein
MWDTIQCREAARQPDEKALRINAVLHGPRAWGALVVHVPDGCMHSYAGTAVRLRAIRAPFAPAPSRIDWRTRGLE